MKKLLWSIVVLGFLAAFISDRGGCQRPLPWNKAHCEEMEQEILDTTVRIAFHGVIEIEDSRDMIQIKGTISHATVKDGRYLLTHNHFGIPLSQLQIFNRYANRSFSGVSVYRLDGTAVLDHAPLDTFTVVSEKGETVLLDFGTIAGEGYFAHVGIASAEVTKACTARLAPNTEVALIDWDEQRHTRVVWAQIQTVYQEKGLSLMQIDHFIETGASGGGVFLHNQHIGNNWARIIETDLNTGNVSQQLTLVALNS